MEDETFFGKTDIDDNSLFYYLTKAKCNIEVDENAETYGIKIQSIKENLVIDELTVHDIDTSKEKVISFLQTLQDNIVTPITLLDVVEDYI